MDRLPSRLRFIDTECCIHKRQWPVASALCMMVSSPGLPAPDEAVVLAYKNSTVSAAAERQGEEAHHLYSKQEARRPGGRPT